MNMKKIFSMLLATVILATSTVFAAPQESNLSAEVKLDATTNSLVVSGKVKVDRSRVPLVLLIKEGGNIVWGDQLETGAPQDGFSAYTFASYPIPKNKISTTFDITVSAQFIDETKNIPYSYSGIDVKHTVLQKIIQYDKSASAASMKTNVIEAYPEVVGIDLEVYDSLSPDAKDILAKVASAGEYTCPAGYVSEADIAEIDAQIQKFASACMEAEVIAKLADVDTKEELLAWVSDDAAFYNFSQDDMGTADDEAKLYSQYFVKIDKTTNLISRITGAASTAMSFTELRDLIFDRVLLTYIETGNYTKTKGIVDNFPTKFAAINSAKRVNDVYMKVTGTYYETIAAFCNACNNCTVSTNNPSPGPSGNTSTRVEYAPGVPVQDTQNIGFTDMSNHQWAVTAVNYLRDSGIISGKSNTQFAPADNVTRAEFAKILVNAIGINVSDYNGEFEDVKASDWYAPFVSAAVKNGIILGADGRFMPNQNITRQDMAVMIQRALNLDDSEYNEVFNDSAYISDYAQKAIFAVYKKGIMQGGGDGHFNPLSNATRAEAAQTVYNMLTK